MQKTNSQLIAEYDAVIIDPEEMRKTLLRERMKIADSNIQKLFDNEGRLIPIHKLPEAVAAAISSIDVDAITGQIKIKFWDKQAALTALEKIHGIVEPDTTVNLNFTLDNLVSAAVETKELRQAENAKILDRVHKGT